MKNVPIKDLCAPDQHVSLIQTTIIALNPLRIKDGTTVNVAVSCLVMPSVGDIVLCAVSEDVSQTTILSVLIRLRPELPIVIAPGSAVELQVSELKVITAQAHFEADQADVSIGMLKRAINRIDEVIEQSVSSFGSVIIRAKRSVRRVKELDEVQAGHIKIESPTLVEVHGSVTAISGEHLIQMQSKQIHMG